MSLGGCSHDSPLPDSDLRTIFRDSDRIRKLGVRVSIDDFGTGFSSMSYITRFSIDRIKIDRSFISGLLNDPNCEAVITAIIAMAHGLGMQVCAEGVETTEQLDFLNRRRCDDIQGYYFSKAVPLAELPDVIRGIQGDLLRPRRAPHRAAVRVPQLLPVAASCNSGVTSSAAHPIVH